MEERPAVWDALIVTRWTQLIQRTLWIAGNSPDRPWQSQPGLDPHELQLRPGCTVERAERFVRNKMP